MYTSEECLRRQNFPLGWCLCEDWPSSEWA